MYLDPNTKVRKMSTQGMGLSGFFDTRIPDSIFVGDHLSPRDESQVIPHESQHLGFNKYRRMPERTGESHSLPDQMRQNRLNRPFQDLFADLSYQKRWDLYLTYGRKYPGIGADFIESNDGFLASLMAIESSLPAGTSLKETDIGKEVFGDNEELWKLYRKNTMLGRDKFEESSYKFKTPSFLEKLRRNIREKTAY